MAAVPIMHRSTTELHFYGGPGFFHKRSQCLVVDFLTPIPTGFLHSQQQSSTRVYSPNPHAPAPAPSTLADPHFRLGCRGAVACTIQVGLTLSLPATDQLLHSAPSPQSPFLTLLISLLVKGLPRCRTFSFLFQLAPPQEYRSCPACSLLFFFCPAPPVGILFVLSGVQGPLLAFCRYSVRIVPFVGRDERHVLLLCRLDSSFYSCFLWVRSSIPV